MKEILILLMAAFGLITSALAAPLAPPPHSYRVTDIGVLPGFDPTYASTWGNSIDTVGDVVGFCVSTSTFLYPPAQHAFRYHAGKLTDLGALFNPSVATEALYTNVAGDVILAQAPSITFPNLISADERPVLYRNGRFTPLAFPFGATASIGGLNDFGQIAGNYALAGKVYAFIIQPNGTFETLPSSSNGAVAVQGINERGQVYGNVQIAPAPSVEQLIALYPTVFSELAGTDEQSVWYDIATYVKYNFPALTAFVSKAVLVSAHASPTDLGSVYGNGPNFTFFDHNTSYASTGTYSVVVNNLGHYVETSQTVTGLFPSYLPVLHSRNKTINLVPGGADLGPGFGAVYAVTGINNFDTVVGYAISNYNPFPFVNFWEGPYMVVEPFIYINGKMYNAGTLIQPQPTTINGLGFYQLLGINDAGQILATGSTRPRHTFMLTPVSH